jgi:hypothetical protein
MNVEHDLLAQTAFDSNLDFTWTVLLLDSKIGVSKPAVSKRD